jgi:VCBS repeat-containing protein
VMLTDTLPLSTTFVSASGTYSTTASGLTWSLGDLAAGQTITRTLTVAVAGDVPRTAVIQNVNYQTSGANAATVSGSPVNVAIQRFSIWLPFVMR